MQIWNQENILEKYGRDLCQAAKDGKLDKIIGRDDEIRRIIEILARKTKNNPVLIGDPGVGKTAIIEGLAQRIVDHDVPMNLSNKTVYELDLALLLAGAKYMGEFEERLKGVLAEIKKQDGKIILFIDELHNIVGAGAAQGTMDASNILKPMLARGEISFIGATTMNEYRKYIEKDAALERRFQRVLIEPPTVEDTIAILRGLKPAYESHHGVRIKDNAIVLAATMSNRYITDRNLPDKAIDLIDEACSAIRMDMDSTPSEIDEIRRKISSLKIEKSALSFEKDQKSKKRAEKIEEEIKKFAKKEEDLSKVWDEEKKNLNDLKLAKQNSENLKIKLQNALNDTNYELAAKIQYGDIPKIEKDIKNLEEKTKNNKILKEEVDEDIILEVISRATKIPLTKLKEGDKEKILNLNDNLNKRVLGQKEPIKLISDAIIRQRAGIKDPNRPIGSFLFLGPTGVGKTEVARALASELFDSEKQITRIDMSEYMEKFSTSRLIGAPPGYIGYDEGGQLTESVRRKPYSIVLFDEIEKAHPEVYNLLLQVLDDGRLTDSHGRVVDFKNTIIIMTSNLGSEILLDDSIKDKKDKIKQIVSFHFKPEFINRIDDIVIFNPLSKETQDLIANKMLNELSEKLAKEDYNITFDKSVSSFVIKSAFDITYGARPIKRFIQKEIETFIAENIIKDKISFKDNYNVKYKNNKLEITKKSK